MTIVVDASVVTSALVDSGETGSWAEEAMREGALIAPHIMPAEVANILRRASLAGQISEESASLCYADLLDLRVELFPYEPFSKRVWELRRNLTAYDAWYVALAESLDAELATLDARLIRASGPRCRFISP